LQFVVGAPVDEDEKAIRAKRKPCVSTDAVSVDALASERTTDFMF
jgi:hypothetical protein